MSAPAMSRRPGVVTFVGVVIYIQAALAAVAAIVVFAFRNSDAIQEATGQSASQLLTTGIIEAVLAVVLFIIGAGIMRGGRGSRFVVGLVMGLRIVSAAWLMLTHHTGGFFGLAIVNIVVGLFVLWALYGNNESDAYFSG